MSFDGDLRAHLIADATITGYVGERITGLRRDEGGALPALTYLRAPELPQNSIDGAPTLSAIRLQVDVWTLDNYDQARAIAQAVKDRMETAATTFRGWCISDNDEYEDDTRISRVILEFSLHYTLA